MPRLAGIALVAAMAAHAAAPASARGLRGANSAAAGRHGLCLGQREPNATSRPFKPLSFIHIPRTSGSTIEGCTDFEENPDYKWGKNNPQLHVSSFALPAPAGQKPSLCNKHHVPPALIPEHFAGRETFCVVRNPYDRLISQLGFHNMHTADNRGCSGAGLNSYLADVLRTIKGSPYHEDCHFVPQAAFVLGWDSRALKVDRERSSCKHVLRFETLARDFDELMAERGYPYRLEGAKRAWAIQSHPPCDTLRKEQIAPDVLRQVEEIYRDDFELFGYPKLSESSFLQTSEAASLQEAAELAQKEVEAWKKEGEIAGKFERDASAKAKGEAMKAAAAEKAQKEAEGLAAQATQAAAAAEQRRQLAEERAAREAARAAAAERRLREAAAAPQE